MKKHLGLVLVAEPYYGGEFQYSLSVIAALEELEKDDYDITIFYRHRAWGKCSNKLRGDNVRWMRYNTAYNLPLRSLGIALRAIDGRKRFSRLYKFLHPLYYCIRSSNVDVVIYPNPITHSFEIARPFIIAVHDLQHRLHPEFSEVSAHGEWERREYLFKNACEKAAAVFVDSESGKEDVVKFYRVRPENVHVLPFVPPSYLRTAQAADVKEKYNLPGKYIFYPAQFWKHKNHGRLIEALHLIKKQKGIEIPVVFVGSKKNAYKEFNAKVLELGLSKQVYELGYVSNEEMVGLYTSARALVMPTFFGPTNIPQLEAFLLGCPVVTSNIGGIHEQVGDAAILVDPYSIESIAEGIERIWDNEELRQELIRKGYARSSSWTQEDFNRSFRAILVNVLPL